MGEFLHFTDSGTSASGKTKVWSADSKGDASVLGEVRWYAPWRRYTFQPSEGTIFDAACLDEITVFLHERMAERKARR